MWPAFFAFLFIAVILSPARAAFTPTGEVYPSNPSTWTSDTYAEVGIIGGGALTVDGGSHLLSNVCYLGDQSLATGLVTISGVGSSWTGLSYVHVGLNGSGTLSIVGGGSVNSTNSPPWEIYLSTIGFFSGSTGVVAVDGTGSNWTTSGVCVGAGGGGTLSITNGGIVTGGYDFIGDESGSSGFVTVSGAGSMWSNGGDLYVGTSGSGTVTQTGGNVSVAGTLWLGYGSTGIGVYNLNGGTLTLQALSGGSGTATFNFGGATLQASAAFSTSVPMTLTGIGGNANIDTAGYAVSLAGPLTGPGGLNKLGGGTLTLSAVNTYTGPTIVTADTLSLTGSLNGSSTLVLNGATFSYAPAANGAAGNSQVVAGLTVNTGFSTVSAAAGNTLALGSIVRNVGSAVCFNDTTSGTITTTQTNTNGILGPWATYGSGASLMYAAAASGGDPSSAIVPYSGATVVTSDVTGLTDTAGTVNYAISSSGGTLSAGVSVNTIQFTSAANTTITASSANPICLNGVMNVGLTTATITGGNLIIGNIRELVFTGPGNVTVESVVQDNQSGDSALVMAAGGTLVLSAANTYRGGTYAVNGTLCVNNTAALGAGPFMIAGNGVVIDNSSMATITLSTDNAQVWNGDFTFVGTQSLNLGNGPVTLGANRTVTVNARTLTVGGTIGGGYSLTKAGAGTLALAGANTYSGPTTVTGGTLSLQNQYALQDSTFQGGTGTLSFGTLTAATFGGLSGGTSSNLTLINSNGQPVALSVGNNDQSTTYSGIIQCLGSLIKVGSGTLIVTGANTYTGSTTVNVGTLACGASNVIGTGSVTVSGGTLSLGSYSDSVGAVTLASGAITGGTLTSTSGFGVQSGSASARLAGSVGLTKTGAGIVVLSGTNAYTGTTTVNNGVLLAATPAALRGSISVASGAAVGGYVASSGYWTEANFATLRAATKWTAGAALAIDTTQGDYAYTSAIGNGGNGGGGRGGGTVSIGVTKLGTNKLTLTGADNYTGLTTVAGGTLELGPAAQNCVLNLGGADIQSGAMVFDYTSGADPIATIQSLLKASCDGGRWDVGQFRDSTASATGLTLGCVDNTATDQVKVMATYPGDFNLDGVVDNLDRAIWFANAFTGTTWQQGDANYDGAVDGLDRDLIMAHTELPPITGMPAAAGVTEVPEPGTWVLLAAALARLLAYARRRRE
jgi:autotransporter-associated beta strand protein/T5SS/PEP-CTERM-associated repeat protein